jgi:hypothetical protein
LRRYLVRKAISITGPDSLMYDAWVDPVAACVPLYRKFSWFNVTNAKAVVNGSEIPNLVIVGPYTYLERRRKDPDSITWFPNGTVGYRYTTHYEFAPALSIDRETGRQLDPTTDIIHIMNIPLYGIAYRLAQLPTIVQQFGNFSFTKALCCYVLDWAISSGFYGAPDLSKTGVFVMRSVDELLWGYVDPIWDMVHPVLKMLEYEASRVFLSEFNGTQPVPSPYTYRAGQRCPLWTNISQCNGSASGWTLEGTGEEENPLTTVAPKESLQWGDERSLGFTGAAGNITTWAGQQRLWWVGPSSEGVDAGLSPVQPGAGAENHSNYGDCSFLEGTDGMRFPPFLDQDTPLTVFLDMAWRTFRFSTTGKGKVKGIDTFKYNIDPSELDNTTMRNKRCFDMAFHGIFNASRAIFGPALLSKAFYLDARLDQSQLNFTLSAANESEMTGRRFSIDRFFEESPSYGFPGGMQSQAFRDAWEPLLEVHPMTGVTLRGVAKGMASTKIGPLKIDGCSLVGSLESLFTSTMNVTETLLPLALLERSAEVSDTLASKLRNAVFLDQMAIPLFAAVVALGLLMLVVGPVRKMRERARESTAKHKNSLNENKNLQTTGSDEDVASMKRLLPHHDESVKGTRSETFTSQTFLNQSESGHPGGTANQRSLSQSIGTENNFISDP